MTDEYESTETEAAPEELYGSEGGYEEHAPASPPDLSDALSQLRERQDQLGGYEPDYEEDGYEPEYEGYEGEELSPEEQAINQLVDERVSEAVEPIYEQQREGEILALAERYPMLREPEVFQAVDNELRAMAEAYGDESLLTDARMAETVLLALTARQQLEQAQAEPGQQQQRGPTVETGAGPGGEVAKPDAVEAAYQSAFAGPDLDDWGFPKS